MPQEIVAYKPPAERYTHRYEGQPVWLSAVFFLTYLIVSLLTAHFVPAGFGIIPADAIAVTALFFGGLRLWPIAALCAFVFARMVGAPPLLLISLPIATTVSAALGAYLLRLWGVDPIFRRRHDALYFILISFVIATVYPTVILLSSAPMAAAFTFPSWGVLYAGAVLSFLVTTPFLLRWLAKPAFNRNRYEIIEIVTVFGILVVLNVAVFILDIPSVLNIPLVFFMLVPLFWIALRLRPRFITLALLLTSVCAIAASTDSADMLIQAELLLIVLAISFFIITSQEEDRRVNTNLMLSQLDSLQNALARINGESKARQDFIAVLAHELRNPLAPVVSTIELLKIKGSRDVEEAEAHKIMEDSMNSVRRILDDLLDVSRFLEGKLTLNREKIDLVAAIKPAILSTEHYRKDRHQTLVYETPDKALWIFADRVRIEQIFSNLLSNASKYSDPGDAVSISIRKIDGMAEVEVKDEGVGLDKETIETIFLPFYQVRNGVRSQMGLGLGLTLVRNFVELHGGSIWAKSEGLGKGSRFIVRLPLAEVTERGSVYF
jgi:signal transduction histidine kinase